MYVFFGFRFCFSLQTAQMNGNSVWGNQIPLNANAFVAHSGWLSNWSYLTAGTRPTSSGPDWLNILLWKSKSKLKIRPQVDTYSIHRSGFWIISLLQNSILEQEECLINYFNFKFSVTSGGREQNCQTREKRMGRYILRCALRIGLLALALTCSAASKNLNILSPISFTCKMHIINTYLWRLL